MTLKVWKCQIGTTLQKQGLWNMDALCLQSGKNSTLMLHLDLKIPVLADWEPSIEMYICLKSMVTKWKVLLVEKLGSYWASLS